MIESISSSEWLPVGVEGFMVSMFPTRVSSSVTYSHLFPDGGTFGSLRSEPRMVLPIEQRFELQAALLFLWDFWTAAQFCHFRCGLCNLHTVP